MSVGQAPLQAPLHDRQMITNPLWVHFLQSVGTILSSIGGSVQSPFSAILQTVYPVGSIYLSASVATNPATILGFGTWTAVAGEFLLGAGGGFTAGSTGGEVNHTLTIPEMPSHNHSSTFVGGSGAIAGGATYTNTATTTGSTGGGGGHNNMPPYLTVYIWQRTA